MPPMLTLAVDTFIMPADADAYLTGRLNALEWDGAPDDRKEAALRMATAMLNRQRYVGRIATLSQPLAWPRIGHAVIDANRQFDNSWQRDAFAQYATSPLIGAGVVDQEGRIIPSNTIPAAIAHATAELALFLLRYDVTDERVRRMVFSVRSEKIGDAAATFDSAGSNENGLPAIVRDMIAPFLTSGLGCSARLVV
jgi:hypothetical protein